MAAKVIQWSKVGTKLGRGGERGEGEGREGLDWESGGRGGGKVGWVGKRGNSFFFLMFLKIILFFFFIFAK